MVAETTATFAGFSSFPRTVSNQFPGQDPVNNKATFLPFFYDTATDRFKENAVEGQAHFWRVTIPYVKNNTQGNRELRVSLTNTNSGFELIQTLIAPNVVGAGEFTVYFLTIADANSIANGYRLRLQTIGLAITINSLAVARISLEKI